MVCDVDVDVGRRMVSDVNVDIGRSMVFGFEERREKFREKNWNKKNIFFFTILL